MDVQKLREEFEQKFQIKMMLYQLHGKVAFVDEINDYRPTITNQGELTENEHRGVAWLSGAWYAFQEQQKIIDELIKSNIAISEQLDRFKKELLK